MFKYENLFDNCNLQHIFNTIRKDTGVAMLNMTIPYSVNGFIAAK